MSLSIQQWIIFGTLLITLILFIIGRWRYDLVALFSLLIVAVTGLVPVNEVFSGFANPAVITVAAVFVLSRALQNSGAVNLIGSRLLKMKGGLTLQLAALTGILALSSAFMNNIGALAIMFPVALQIARRKNIPVSALLMPMAFASLLGGLTTLIGTPANIILSSFREHEIGKPFGMFDYTPVGIIVTIAGLAFIIFIGWRLIPSRRGKVESEELFEIEKYVTEVRLLEDSKLNGKRLPEINSFVTNGVNIIGLIRGGEKRYSPAPQTLFKAEDILILEVDTEDLHQLLTKARLELVGTEDINRKDLESDEIALMEAVITPYSRMVGETAISLDLRKRFGMNLLAISRQDRRLWARLNSIRLKSGDALLFQCPAGLVKKTLSDLGCLPLARRELNIAQSSQIIPSIAIFGAALILSAAGILPVQVSFVAAAVIMLATNLVSLREVYECIDWPIIILLGAMIPVSIALETSGGAQLIAEFLLHISSKIPVTAVLTIAMVITMLLSNVVNNAAAVVLMAPIAISVAQGLGVSIDAFLMAVVIGASCPFMTPIGHQSNTLVLGPGGYRFGDYWKMGLPLSVIVVAVAIPLILIFWPL
ncbi:MAG TPA: SLC13 family permease [Firmicutes bacterium]|nr:SLC13 family permease [Bacillota bacterium]